MKKHQDPFTKILVVTATIIGTAILLRIAEKLLKALAPTLDGYMDHLISKIPTPPKTDSDIPSSFNINDFLR